MIDTWKERPKKSPDASKEDPRKHPRPEMQPEKAMRGLKEEAQDPHGAQEANQARKVSNYLSNFDGFQKKQKNPK